ncbi:MAG: hypothetical protein J6U05_01855 [Neisseriaceae bacterium]|nr:hypothetical protein [Neisseriaceae bacterium]
MSVCSYQSNAFRLPENGKNGIVSFITQCKNISGSLKHHTKPTTVITSRQTSVSNFIAYACVVARMRSIRGNPISCV